MVVTQTPASYFGSKFEMDWILDFYPPDDSYDTYVEEYGGMAGLLLKKKPSAIEVYNDVNKDLVNFWQVCRDHPYSLCRAMAMTPIAYSEWRDACRKLDSSTKLAKAARALVDRLGAALAPGAPWGELGADLKEALESVETGDYDENEAIERARLFLIKARQSMAGAPGRAWQASVTHVRRLMSSTCSAWLNLPIAIQECGMRFARVQIENRPAIHVAEKYDNPRTLHYFDPPYHPDTCQTGVYSAAGGAEMTHEDHVQLLTCIVSLKGHVVVSGYDHPVYEEMLVKGAGFSVHRREVACRSAVSASGSVAEIKTRTEVVWFKHNVAGGGGGLFA